MKKFFIFLVLISLFTAIFHAAASDMQRLDGKILRTDTKNRTFLAEFIHPATGEKFQKEFEVRDSTGFKKIKKLERVKPGDLASIDYNEEDGKAVAIYVDLLPAGGVSVVTPTEVASSIAKIFHQTEKGTATPSGRDAANETNTSKGILHFQAGDYPEARDSFLKAIEEDPGDPELHFYLGQAYLALGQMPAARLAFEKTAALDGNHLGAMYGLGLVLDENRSPAAARYFRKVIALDPMMKDAHFRLGAIAYGRERFREAEDAFRRVAVIDSHDVTAFYNLGLSQLRQGKPEAARESFRSVLKLDADNPAALFQMAFTYESQGFYEQAREFYRKTIRAAPDDLDARERLESLERGIALGRGPIDQHLHSQNRPPFGSSTSGGGRSAMETLLPQGRFGPLLGGTGAFASGNETQSSIGQGGWLQAGLAVLAEMMKGRESNQN